MHKLKSNEEQERKFGRKKNVSKEDKWSTKPLKVEYFHYTHIIIEIKKRIKLIRSIRLIR